MNGSESLVRRVAWIAIAFSIPALAWSAGGARPGGRFDDRFLDRDGAVIGVRPAPVSSLATGDPLRTNWERVTAELEGRWQVWVDERSGLPTLATGAGVQWAVLGTDEQPPTLEALAIRAERFLQSQAAVLGAWGDQVALDRDASGPRGPNAWMIRFGQVVDGVRVEGASYDFHVGHGRLVAFGARRWAPVRIDPTPSLTPDEARARLDDDLRPSPDDGITDLGPPELVLLPVNADPDGPSAWTGTRGDGIVHRLVWRFRFTDRDGVATWTGEVDAHTGEIAAFYDDTDYGRIGGHASPISDDLSCADGGCLRPGTPMPFADFTEDGGAVQFAGQHGLYECASAGSTIETTLAGTYFRIEDSCGVVTETTTCDGDLDLGVADDVNCGAAAGASPGNTDGARSAYYSLNLVNRKARFWIPGNTWLETSQVTARTNVDSACNASWSGNTITLYRAGSGCGNIAQIQGVTVHEWGHGMDHNDGGGTDNPGEAYADVVAVFEARESCMGRGFHVGETCDGYGDTCLTCTGIRELDWDGRQAHSPATPSGYLATYCSAGGGTCGKEVHCESHVPSEAMFDLATRDLPAMGIDPDTAWQLAERLWYQSRPGSGGEIYNCTLPSSDSCGIGSWYQQLRLQDDDDGNLANGTPHAAAIFAAFDRHDIACGVVSDPGNRNSSSCPTIEAPVAGFTAMTDAVEVSWGPVAGAAGYRVYRNENGCARAQFPIAETDAVTHSVIDDGLANGFPVFYRVQGVGSNPACEGPVSACFEAAAQQTAGSLRLDRGAYACDATVVLEVTDLNHPSSSVTVTIRSDTEATPEPVVLAETAVGSARFVGSIALTGAPAATDGLLSVGDGDTIVAEYVDLDDGEGGIDVARQATALTDCVGPVHTVVNVRNVTDSTATVAWTTSEPTTGRVEWGPTAALGSQLASRVPGTDHAVEIGPFTACDRVYFRVISSDLADNVTIADADGAPFEFNAYEIQGILFEDGFETDTGWTLAGEWEIDVPQGLGTAPGDPTVASEGAKILGHDLSGLGAAPGDYEFNTTQTATSPSIDLSAATSAELRFDRWLNVEGAGTSTLLAKDANGVWQTVTSLSSVVESSWSERVYDVSQSAAGNPAFQLRFQQGARFGRDAGWNVDRLVLRDPSVAPYGACDGCEGAPTFAGVAAVTDESCATAGLSVSWSPAPAWGTGSGGTYAVYRALVPLFTPGPANFVASGVVGTSWLDTTAPADVTVYYVVRAENDESCGVGPGNGGLTDPNLVTAAAVDVTGQTPPGDVGDTVLLSAVGGTDVRLTWNVVPEAAIYRVYRSTTPDTGFAMIGEPAGTSFDDPGALADGQTYFYEVTAVNECGAEGPGL